jgi:formate hydrogenlyase transcriptional activator
MEIDVSILLQFSHDMAAVRTRSDLALAITGVLTKSSLIKRFAIRIIPADGVSPDVFIDDPHVSFPLERGGLVNGMLSDVVLASGEPILFDKDDGIRKAGFERLVGGALRSGDRVIGILWVEPVRLGLHLFKALCSQVSIVLANILSNEKMDLCKRRLGEDHFKEPIGAGPDLSEMIGGGVEIQKVYQLISQVAFSSSTVLISGETGTGKELIARAIHYNSPRKDNPMVKVNCAALPANLIESELFGHERGSFTGAIERRTGKFEMADKGSLFLDEIAEIPAGLQAKLLRALQEREIERVGGKQAIKVDVRIIAATNRDLKKEIREGRFRSDLYYRLNVFPIRLPGLRDRREDIPVLAAHFLARYARNTGKAVNAISRRAMDDLCQYTWPGNVRELEHIIERSILLAGGSIINEVALPKAEKVTAEAADREHRVKTIKENEREHIVRVLKRCNGRIAGRGGAAELLGVPASTLNSKIARLMINKPQISRL